MTASDQDKIMHQGRRHFICSASAALFLAGCQRSTQTAQSLPGAYWPQVEKPEIPRPVPPLAVEPLPSSPPAGNLGTPDNPIPRTRWTRAGVGSRNIYAMGPIQRITLHHEGWHTVNFTDYNSTVDRLELIRTSHCSRGFADIGYHYIVDRAGRVYEGRPLRFQGAHVRNNNENNLGIMCLGNFDQQQPTDAQLRSLAATVSRLRQQFKVPYQRIYTHRELTATACPGKNMQPRIAAMRSNNAFA